MEDHVLEAAFVPAIDETAEGIHASAQWYGVILFPIHRFACELARQERESAALRLECLRDRLVDALVGLGARVFGQEARRLPNTVYFAVPDIDGETLVAQLDRAGYAVASGAACSSANPQPSHVLQAMGIEPGLARGAVRVSLGRTTSAGDVDGFITTLQATCLRLQRLTALAV